MKTLVFITLIFTFAKVECQESISEAKINFTLPNKHWKLSAKENPDEGTTVYSYKRDPVVNINDLSIIPNISFIVEDLPDGNPDVINYSVLKRLNIPFKIKETFTNKDNRLKFKNAIAYKAIYNDPLEHTVYIIHLISNSKGVQVIMDITSDLFQKYENEFIKSMQSITSNSL